MYCPKCGTENPDNAQLCRSCSWVLPTISVAPNPNAKTSKLAVTSLVLAILSYLTLFTTMVPALICGILAVFKIEKSAGRLKGRGLAIAGIAVSGVSLFVLPIFLAILMPALARTRALAYQMVCGTNMSGLGRAMFIYASENNNTFPTPSKWCDLLIENTDVSAEIFLCRGSNEGPCSYAMNENIKNTDVNNPSDIVLLFETYPGWNQFGGPEILSIDNHAGEGCNVMYLDGRVEFIKQENFNNLRWTDE